MGDLERRLREAMIGAAERPPAGLLEAIRRRRRRRIRRLSAVSVAAVAAVAIAAPVAARDLPGSSRAGDPAAAPRAAPGTVLRDCQSSEGGTLGSGWQADSAHAGPVWFIYARPVGGQRLSAGRPTVSAMAIGIENGRTAVVSAAPAAGGRFHFLARFSGGPDHYTLAQGAPGLTLQGCPHGPGTSGQPASYAPGLTLFWEGYVTDLRGCIPLQVRTSPGRAPIRVTIVTAAGFCRA